MKFITYLGSKAQREYTIKLKKYLAYAACIVVCVSSEDKQHLKAAGKSINSGQFAKICRLSAGIEKSRICRIERIGNKALSPTRQVKKSCTFDYILLHHNA